jgi:protein tyrosine phosphatase (PTP) superfamily phosphohydrolase (DUF442 family)
MPGHNRTARTAVPALLCAVILCALAACAPGGRDNAAGAAPDNPRAGQDATARQAPAGTPDRDAGDDRPAGWAVPLDRPGLPNLHKVSDTLYRGAQPEDGGWAELKEMGIRTVVNLRLTRSDREDTERHGLGYARIRMEAWDVDEDELVEFLRFVQNPANQPVFVHCNHGADRTGLACAVYRVALQGWSPTDAAREMQDGGYGFHHIWTHLPDYIEQMDADRLRAGAGLETERTGE